MHLFFHHLEAAEQAKNTTQHCANKQLAYLA